MPGCAGEAPYVPPGTLVQYRVLLAEVDRLIGEVEGEPKLLAECQRFLRHLHRRKIGLEHTIGQKERAMAYRGKEREDERLDDQVARGQTDDAWGHGDPV